MSNLELHNKNTDSFPQELTEISEEISDLKSQIWNPESNLELDNESTNSFPQELTEISEETSDLKSQIWNPESNLKSKKENSESKKESNAWEFKYIRDSDEYIIYSYITNSIALPYIIKKLAKSKLNLENAKWIKITDIKWNKYAETKVFKKWEKVFVKIPKKENPESEKESKKENSESEKESTEKMRCKWWEYFWIDISENNTLSLTEFKEWNREKRDSKRQDWRWISFIYIRASDWTKTDTKLTTHLNGITKYNKDKIIINNNEKIAVWFYHRLNWKNSTTQADHFINLYKKNKNKSWGNDLIPMCDVENWSETWWWMDKRKKETENQNKSRVRNQILTRLKRVESKTWIKPWIYINLSNYKKYIQWDNRFNKYETRVAAYDNNTRDSSFAKSWSIDNSGIYPSIYQSKQTWRVKWIWNDNWYTDMNRTKNITKLFSKNNKS